MVHRDLGNERRLRYGNGRTAAHIVQCDFALNAIGRKPNSWRAGPMTYSVDGRQYVAGMDGRGLLPFPLGYK
jgi:hypothetical protein